MPLLSYDAQSGKVVGCTLRLHLSPYTVLTFTSPTISLTAVSWSDICVR